MNAQIQSAIRGGLKVAAGYLIAKGVDADAVNGAIEGIAILGSGIVSALIVQAWSFLSIEKLKKKIRF